jgi:hypothetical protein
MNGSFVYRAANAGLETALLNGPLNGLAITNTTYTNTVPTNCLYYTYAVRAARLVQTGGGSFTNLSQAINRQIP